MKLSSRSCGERQNKLPQDSFLRDPLLEAGETGDGGDGENLFRMGDGRGGGAAATSSSSDVKETKVTGACLSSVGVEMTRRGLVGGCRRKLRLPKDAGWKGYESGGGSLPSKRASASERFSRR